MVYLNFEGVTLTSINTQPDDATTNRTWMINEVISAGNTLSIPPFNPNDLGELNGATSRQQIIDYTLNELRTYHTPYNIQFTTTRPSPGQYHMVVFGGTCSSVVGQGCAGIAPLDCNDFSPSNIVFAFPQGLRAVDLAPTAAQELAHALGLSHTQDNSDLMFPSIQSNLPTHYGAGPIPPQDQGPCGNGSFQDSHEKLLSITGFPGQDGSPPVVRISSPDNGEVISIGTEVVASIEDASPIAKAILSLNNVEVQTLTSPPFTFQIPATSPRGQVRLEIRATDNQGNEAGNRITVYIGSGDEEPCENGQCPDGFSCSEMLCFPDSSVGPANLGATCVNNEDCLSDACATVGDDKKCSQTCDAENLCPDGFDCLGGTACWPKESSSGGCSIGGSSRGVLSSLSFLFFALFFSRKRRRN